MSQVLVTGGAGYRGSHTVKKLGESGVDVVTVDNLSKGFREAVLYGDFYEGDVADGDLISRIISPRNYSQNKNILSSNIASCTHN